MKKRFLLLTLIMCLFGGVKSSLLKAQDDSNVVTIGEGKSTSQNAPFRTFNNNSGSQAIYTSTEINKAGTITHIAYKIKSVDGGAPYTRNIKVYLKETDKVCYVKGESYLVMASSDVKYEGNYSYTENDEWITIELTGGGFIYSGDKNLVVSVEDNTNKCTYDNNSYIDYTHFYADYFQDAMAIYKTSTTNMMSVGSNCLVENCRPQIQLTFASDGGGEDDPETPADPTAPTVVSPADDATISGTTVNLRWSYGENNTATHYQVSLGTDNENLSVKTDGWVARTELGTGGFATDDELPVDDLIYGTTYYWRVDVRNGEGTPVEGTIWSFATPASAAFEFTTEGNWNEGANWNGGAVPGNGAIVVLKANATITAEDNINVADLTISEGASLTINGSLNITGKFSNTDASKLVINDGGQIFQKNTGVKATFNMNINNPTEWSENNIDGWQFISSPFTDASINDFVTTGDGNDYDLYKFDGKQVGAEWQNQKAIATFDTQFVPGRGYLASYESKKDVSVSGTLRNELTMNYTFGDYQYNVGLKDFYLVGNPFPFDMDMSKLYNMTYNIIEGYAVVNNGSYSYYNLEGTIPAGDGFFVKVTGADATFYYNHEAKSSRSGNANSLNIIATGNAGNDNVVVNFNGEGEGFPKLQNFNDAIATVYVQNNDVNYAIFNCNEDVQEIELCFNANQMGNYTISAQAEGKFETVTLVDRFTGIETNLLVEDYSFTAMSEENNNRFILKLAVSDQQSAVSDNFVYQSGEELIIDAEGTVQIIDMMGRVVYTSNVENNNRINVSDFNNGAYVVRVINESEIKVEKVVIY